MAGIVLDEAGHADRLGFDTIHRVGDIGGQLLALALRQFGIAADRRQRRAEFVTGVGHELTHPRLAGMAGRERAGDPVQHAVERRTQLPDLGVRGDGVDVHDLCRQLDLSTVQFPVGHVARGGGNP